MSEVEITDENNEITIGELIKYNLSDVYAWIGCHLHEKDFLSESELKTFNDVVKFFIKGRPSLINPHPPTPLVNNDQ